MDLFKRIGKIINPNGFKAINSKEFKQNLLSYNIIDIEILSGCEIELTLSNKSKIRVIGSDLRFLISKPIE